MWGNVRGAVEDSQRPQINHWGWSSRSICWELLALEAEHVVIWPNQGNRKIFEDKLNQNRFELRSYRGRNVKIKRAKLLA